MSTYEPESWEIDLRPVDLDRSALGVASDDALLEQLRRVLAAVDPVPDSVVRLAQAAYEMRDLEAQLAAVVADTATGAGDLVLVRTSGLVPRRLSFEVGETALDLELLPTRAGVRLRGLLVGAAQGRVVVEQTDGAVEVEVDELGRFETDDLPPGPKRLRWVDAQGCATVSESFVG